MATVQSRRQIGPNRLTNMGQDDLRSEFGTESVKDNNMSMLLPGMGKVGAAT